MIFIAFSLSMEAGLLVGIALSLHHLLIKPGLFLLTEQTLNRWGMVLFILFALSLVGVPPLPGFWAKFSLLTALVESGGWLNGVALTVFLFATVVEASYLFRVVSHFYQGSGTIHEVEQDASINRGMNGVMLASLVAAGLLLTTWQIQQVGDGIDAIALQAADERQVIGTVMPQTAGGGE